MEQINCILCSGSLEKRTDKNGKPYFVCDPCGTQFFVRRAEGIRNLEALINGQKDLSRAVTEHAGDLRRIRRDLKELDSRIECFDDEDIRWIEKFSKRLNGFLSKIEGAIEVVDKKAQQIRRTHERE